MTVHAVGLDLSLARTGIATVDGTLHSIKPRTGPENHARRLHEIIAQLDPHLRHGQADVAVIEGYNPGGIQGFTMARIGELGGAVRMRLFELDIPYVEVPPSMLKKWATGKGGATKDEMLAAAMDRGASPANHDEADAWFLRQTAVEFGERFTARWREDAALLAFLKGGSSR